MTLVASDMTDSRIVVLMLLRTLSSTKLSSYLVDFVAIFVLSGTVYIRNKGWEGAEWRPRLGNLQGAGFPFIYPGRQIALVGTQGYGQRTSVGSAKQSILIELD